ncbi:GNAT family N-acetyltransferase [Paractinoplanes atraurantiacus]|uniref:Predicted acetyltransferase n=1 Tax=Paractinoplanes atraurantiacus TaxID=1036182 RepID=A0A285HXD6_9ACTN|nr:GNAT family N-acetyltransferase [Actinoplanes atraurantiacus]SNY40402.1 Predicted acetyltransferase [Actinoplanes atraurantiacus]
MPELIAPTTRLHKSWLESRDEFGPGTHQDGAGLRPTDEVDTDAGFATWVRRLLAEQDPAVPPADGWVHCSYRWIVEDDQYLGAIALRHTLNDMLLNYGGHIGYSVRPSARRRGLAGWAVSQILDEARTLPLDRVLITCDPGNIPSARTIESNGGVLEDIRTTDGKTVKRYWISL